MECNVYKTVNDRVIITIVVSFREMQQKIKEESSHFAIRQKDKEGKSLFEEFVLDEGYETKFRSYFSSAQGELTEYLSAYLKNMPATSEVFDTAVDDDWVVQLPMPASFNESLSRAIAIKIENFIESYIMYLWLATKDMEKAEVYLAQSMKFKEAINSNLNKRSGSITRPTGYW